MGGASSETGGRNGGVAVPAVTRSHPRNTTVAIPIDAVADAAIAARAGAQNHVRCGVCEAIVDGEPGGHGLLIWSRGDEVRYEEPALCDECATVLGMSAIAQWRREDEDEG